MREGPLGSSRLSKPASYQEALLQQSYVVTSVESSSSAPGCDCLAHRSGNAADHPVREPRYRSTISPDALGDEASVGPAAMAFATVVEPGPQHSVFIEHVVVSTAVHVGIREADPLAPGTIHTLCDHSLMGPAWLPTVTWGVQQCLKAPCVVKHQVVHASIGN